MMMITRVFYLRKHAFATCLHFGALARPSCRSPSFLPSQAEATYIRGKSDKKLGDYGGAISEVLAGSTLLLRGVLAHSGEF